MKRFFSVTGTEFGTPHVIIQLEGLLKKRFPSSKLYVLLLTIADTKEAGMLVEQHLRNHMARSWSGHHKHHYFGNRQHPCCPQRGSSVATAEQRGFEQGELRMWIHMMLPLDHRGSGNYKDQSILLRGYAVEEDLSSCGWRGTHWKTWRLWQGGKKTVQPLGHHPRHCRCHHLDCHRRLAYYYEACWKMLISSSFLSWPSPDEWPAFLSSQEKTLIQACGLLHI